MKYELKKQPNLKRQEKLNKKNKLLKSISFIFMIAILILIVWIIFFKNRVYTKEYKNDKLSFKYDTTWTINKSESNYIALTNKTNSIVSIKISNLDSKTSNLNIENLADEVRFDIEKQNTSYKLLKEEKKDVSINNYKAYKLLYEDGSNQSLVVILKNDNELYVVNYISNNDTFDIVLDSFQLILGTLSFK